MFVITLELYPSVMSLCCRCHQFNLYLRFSLIEASVNYVTTSYWLSSVTEETCFSADTVTSYGDFADVSN